MVSFKEFEKLMDPIINFQKEYKETCKAFKVLSEDFCTPKLGSRLIESYISLLEKYLNITTEDIEYFVWECGCGESANAVTFPDGKIFYMDSIKSLYNSLVYINVSTDREE